MAYGNVTTLNSPESLTDRILPRERRESSVAHRAGPPIYRSGDILRALVEPDPRIVSASPPAVNRVSAQLKSKAAVIEDGLAADDLRLVSAGIGDCDAGYTLGEVFEALNAAAVADGLRVEAPATLVDRTMHLAYGDVRGLHELISGAKGFLDALLGVESRDHLTATHGGRAAVFIAIKAFLDYMRVRLQERGIPGPPKIAVPVPTWGTYPNIVAQALEPGCFVPLPCDGGLLSAELLDQACAADPSISMLIYCNPINPTGLTYGSDRQAAIARVVYKHHLAVHCDDMYAMFAWERPHRSLLRAAAAMESSGERGVGAWVASHLTLLTGVMKAGGSGTRVNFLVTPNPDLRARVTAVQGDLYGPPPLLSQLLQLAFIRNGGPERVWHQLNARRRALERALTAIREQLAGTPVEVSWTAMEGGFYTAVRFRGVKGCAYRSRREDASVAIDTGEHFAHFMLEQAGIITSPDVAACVDDPELLRYAYGTMTLADLEILPQQTIQAIRRLVQG